MKVSPDTLNQTFEIYSRNGTAGKDEFGKKYFDNLPFVMKDSFYVAVVCPVVHYSMGGLKTNSNAEVLDKKGKPIAGLWVTGEACGGIHDKNRMGGNSLLDCVVWGRLSGSSACAAALQNKAVQRINTIVKHVDVPASKPNENKNTKKVYTMSDVSKHNTEKDCWIVVNGEVLDVTSFLDKHPGGKQVLLLWGGKDATTEFNMFHKKDAVQKYAPELILGKLA
jgi:succinate dehydrogenase/fumarate reductase flavoprotein subunit